LEQNSFERRNDDAILPLRNKIAYGVGGFAGPLMVDINSWLLLYYNTILKVNAALVGWALFFPRLYDAVTDPLMGQISDNFRSRWGRRRPFILFGGPLCCLVFFLMWAAPTGLSETGTFIYLVVFYILFQTMVTVTMVPYAALGAELSTDYDERTRIFAWRSWFENIGAVIIIPIYQVTHSSLFDTPREGFITYAGGLAIIALVAFMWVFLGTREEVQIQAQPRMKVLPAIRETFANQPFLLVAFGMLAMNVSFFFLGSFYNYLTIFYVFGGDKPAAGLLLTVNGLLGMAVEIAGVPLCAWLGLKFGKRRALLICLTMLTISPLLTWFLYNPTYPYLQLLMAIFFAPAVPGIALLPRAMIADVIDLDELRTGRRREGMYLAIYEFMRKLSASLLTLVVSYILIWVGFNENIDVQAPETLTKLRLIFALLPCFMAIVATVLIYRYPLSEERVRETRAILEARHDQPTNHG
jgi:GPH family glycoside/pentoside/hexuronide:cation symporter